MSTDGFGDVTSSEGASKLTRRRLLRVTGAAALGIAAGDLLAACGSSSTSSATLASSGHAGKISPGVGQELASLLGVTQHDASLAAGKTWKLGSALAVTGQGAAYGVLMGSGIELAVKHIQLAGGPQIQYTLKDHQSGNPALGAQIGRQFGAAGVAAQLTSFNGILGAEIPSIGQYKIMSFDGGGSTGPFTNKPYFWGTRAVTPQQIFGGEFAWVAKAHPSIKRVFLVYPDLGAEDVASYFATLKPALSQAGLELVGSVKYPYGATDFSQPVRVLSGAPAHDLVKLVAFGTDPGYFMKQYTAAGLHTQVLGSELTKDAVKIAGAAYPGIWVASDYFDYANPPNPLSRLFVTEFTKAYGQMSSSNFYSANYYESTLALWELVRRVLRKGGDLNNGEDLQNALIAEPSVSSVYGGDANTLGSMGFDLTSHRLTKRPCSVFTVVDQSGTTKLLATFNIDPANDYSLKLVST